MIRRARATLLLTLAAALLAACDAGPVLTGRPAGLSPSPGPSGSAAVPTEAPFRAAAWPEAGSACGEEGYSGSLGRIEATEPRTVVFTLCRPDGAFLSRVAHPSLGILDAAAIERIAADPAARRAIEGTGPYRIEAWTSDDNVRLGRVGDKASAAAKVPTLILRWAADPTQRTIALQSAVVDGMDAPGPQDLERIATLPEMAVMPRDGLATAYLGFGTGTGLGKVAVRKALAQSLDRDALATDAFDPGTTSATHVGPCVVDGACGGDDWYGFNAPAASAALAAAKFDLGETYPLHIPDRPVPGLPDPAGLAAAVKAQLEDNVGLRLKVDPMPVRDYTTDLATGKIDGFYLGGVASSEADPAAYLDPLFRKGLKSTAAGRVPKAGAALADAAGTADPKERAAAFARANDAIRDAAPIVPLGHPGSVAAFRADVTGVATSPVGLDPLGAFTPGDRPQLVFMQATQPDGAYCGDQASLDAYRLCGLVQEGLYGFEPGTMTVEPRLAQGCEPDAQAKVWTCRLRQGVDFSDGARLDAGDVLASYVAQWDRSQPLRQGSDTPFPAWNQLFGDTIGG